MSKFKEPAFTKDELDSKKTNCDFGYSNNMLVPGHDFKKKLFASKKDIEFVAAQEKLDGTIKKRECHHKINSFGYARLDDDSLIFGIKWRSHSSLGPSRIGQSAINKYKQFLGYLLEQAGWQGIKEDSLGDYVVPLTSKKNIELLHTLSPSIGFHYKSMIPDMDTLEQLEAEVLYKERSLYRSNSVKERY